MSATESWVKEFRRAIKSSIGSGWQVSNDRGNMRLLHGNKKDGYFNKPSFRMAKRSMVRCL